MLKQYPNKPVAIVEGESTAIVSAGFMPEFTWLATGGCNGCKWTDYDVFKVLSKRSIILFPDLGYYEKWSEKAALLRKYGYKVKVSDLLERKSTQEEKAKGNLDLRDYLVKTEYVT